MTTRVTENLALELALLVLLAVLWGSSYLLVKVALDTIPPVTLIAARVAIADAFLVAVMMWRGKRLTKDSRTWRMLFVQAIFNSIGAWTLLAWGQQMAILLSAVLYAGAAILGVVAINAPQRRR